eukprot:CAMPEP_0202864280 /NCGR_PEP_ID=MMETSP1391-20130828/4586_1 /ASSEMBLY_ACC=CAM_ASM_000867 /TAXON_ID=1034604 /ORGANISM="Chlamydomonas leiostraca, Strain SAG 11-49" /LENGTH=187 /DNA_ID=CAMNT_0049544011 /DNA_START=87 /DNA_END=651 /DNA_ORIENTATION=-
MDQSGQFVQKAEFIDDVAKFMQGKSVDTVLEGLNEQHRKFKLLEGQMMQRKARLMTKLPEIQKALDIVKAMIAKSSSGDEMVIDFELAESVYAKTKVKNVKTVNLWLGADVMVEYSLEEAKELLESNLGNCKSNITTTDDDLGLIKDNLTTLEVSLSRVWNYDVGGGARLALRARHDESMQQHQAVS